MWRLSAECAAAGAPASAGPAQQNALLPVLAGTDKLAGKACTQVWKSPHALHTVATAQPGLGTRLNGGLPSRPEAGMRCIHSRIALVQAISVPLHSRRSPGL